MTAWASEEISKTRRPTNWRCHIVAPGHMKQTSMGHLRVRFAEADGNRTRQPAFAGSPVLKTGGPTRRPDASAN
jgi:hypothetical protein